MREASGETRANIGFLTVRAFGGDQKNINALHFGGGRGHGSQFARTR
jgi:hypothetical protein